MARARFVVTAVVAAAFLSACGGDSQPSAEERKAAKSRWVQRVDAACRKANEAIAERGWPADLVDLDRLVVRGIEDAQAAIREIAALEVPEGAGPQPAAFVRDLKALESELGKLSDASEDLEPAALVKAAEGLKPRLAAADQAAFDAGLSECLSHDERLFIPDAIRAPVFAEQLNQLDRSLLRRVERIDLADVSTPGEVAQALARYNEVIDAAIEGVAALDPPIWAAEQSAGYQDALRKLESATEEFNELLVQDKGKAPHELDRSKYLRAQKEINVALKAEMKARRKMLRAVGAGPTGVSPDSGEAAEPNDGQIS
jgi:hypothetical protein